MPEDHTGTFGSENQPHPSTAPKPASGEELLLDRRSNSLEETDRIARAFFRESLQKLSGGAVLLLEGELGAGKTAFCRSIGGELGIIDPVNSPTFNLLLQHRGERGLLYHYDLYRLEGASLEELEFEDFWEDSVEDHFTIHAIEWWQKAGTIRSRLAVFRVLLTYDHNSPEHGRRIRIFRRTD